MKGSQIALVAAVVLLVAVSSGFTGYSIGKRQARGPWAERMHAGLKGADMPGGFSRLEKLEKLRELHQKNPELFNKVVENRKEQVRERLAQLKQENPEKYKEIIQKQIDRMEATLAKLKAELPEANQK